MRAPAFCRLLQVLKEGLSVVALCVVQLGILPVPLLDYSYNSTVLAGILNRRR